MKTRLVWIITFFVGLTISSCSEEDAFQKIAETELLSELENCNLTIINNSLAECQLENKFDSEISIWTWNLRFFPQARSTSQSVIKLIEYYKPGIIAFQEIDDNAEFMRMMDTMPLYEGWVVNLSGSLDLAFAYNTCLVSSVSEPEIILNGLVEPRPPIQWKAIVGDQEITLINIHLKCCDEGAERRATALENISNYMLSELENQPLILLGDFNDDVNDRPLQILANDTANFRFSDAHVSAGDAANWSYPGWPSDLDHILVSDELFSSVDTASTVLLDNCQSSYFRDISDHRPVELLISF